MRGRETAETDAALFFGVVDAQFGDAADFEQAFLAKGLEEPVQKDLGLALFVTGDMSGGPVDEFLKTGFAVLGHVGRR